MGFAIQGSQEMGPHASQVLGVTEGSGPLKTHGRLRGSLGLPQGPGSFLTPGGPPSPALTSGTWALKGGVGPSLLPATHPEAGPQAPGSSMSWGTHLDVLAGPSHVATAWGPSGPVSPVSLKDRNDLPLAESAPQTP